VIAAVAANRPLHALLAGALLVPAFAPFNLWPLLLIALLLLSHLWWRAASAREAALIGWFAGCGLFGAGVSWVWVVIHQFGGSGLIVATLLTLLFVALLALYLALLGLLLGAIRPHLTAATWWLLLLPAGWILIEWLRSHLFTGFPWLLIGYSQLDGPLAGYAPIIGVLGIGWLLLLTVGGIGWALSTRRRTRAASAPAAVLLLTLLLIWGAGPLLQQIAWSEPAGAPLPVALLQGNVPQESKWDPNTAQLRLDRYARLSEAQFGRAALILWPENAITLFHHQIDLVYLQPLAAAAAAAGSELLLGLPVLTADGNGYYTSMVVPGEQSHFYHKHHLVPFGEYLPFASLLRGLIAFFDLPMSGFSPGSAQQPPLPIAGQLAAVTICYEDAFAATNRSVMAAATLLVNGSNNAWFGDSLAPHQHLQIARMRALESRRPLLRATTNGISALVDHRGQLIARSPQFATATVVGEVVPQRGLTPWLRWGDGPLLLLLLLSLLPCGVGVIRA